MPKISGMGFQHLYRAVYSALRSWNKLHVDQLDSFGQLQLLRDHGYHRQNVEPSHKRTLLNSLLLDCVHELEGRQPLEAEVLRQRFVKGEIILKVANQLNISQDQLNRLQRQAVKDLTELLIGREQALRARKSIQILADLPRVNQSAFVDANGRLARLREWASSDGPPFVVALSGLSGIGKTWLARALVHQLVPNFHYDNVLWVAAQSAGALESQQPWLRLLAQQALPQLPFLPDQVLVQLRRHFGIHPSFVVLDIAQQQMHENPELENLVSLANPAKFLILSRTRPPALGGIQFLALPEWPQGAAQQLAVQYARAVGTGDIEEAKIVMETDGQEIHDLVGGHPAALRLAIGLLAVLPMRAVRQAFQGGGDDQVAALYRRVYQRSWQSLRSPSKQLLQALAAVQRKEHTYEQILSYSGLPHVEINAALKELHLYSLLERTGSPAEPLYRLARLTVSFLRSEYVNLI